MRTITLEEHFAIPAFFDGPGRELEKRRAETVGSRYANLIERLVDVGAKRIAEMDAAGIDMQVVSLTAPGVEQLDPTDAVALARDANDSLAEAVKKNPARFAGFAAVPTPAPDKAAAELERYVRRQLQGRCYQRPAFAAATSTAHSISPILGSRAGAGRAALHSSDPAAPGGARHLLRRFRFSMLTQRCWPAAPGTGTSRLPSMSSA